jgi:hypothetical protein
VSHWVEKEGGGGGGVDSAIQQHRHVAGRRINTGGGAPQVRVGAGGGTGSAAEATSGQWVVGGAVEGGLWRGGEEEDDVGVSRYGYRMMGCR